MTVAGFGPFEFTNANGQQVSIPLTALKTDTSGAIVIDTSVWKPAIPYGAADTAVITALLGEYATQQLMTAQAAAPLRPAMVLTAATPGVSGNNIQATVVVHADSSGDPTLATLDITITETEAYKGIAVAGIAASLGDGTNAGSQPGLATVDPTSIDKTKLPVALTATAFTGPADPTKHATLDIQDGSKNKVFTLVARSAGAGGAVTTAAIANIDTGAGTFDLTLVWSATATGVKLASLAADTASLAYEVAFTPPPSGVWSLPAAGAGIALSGGAGATAASATLFTST